MADIVEQVSVRLDEEQKEILDRLQASYPAMSRNGLFLQLLYEWHWNKERGDGKAARLERIEADVAEIKAILAEWYEAHTPGK